jgi:hypothetical protein
MHLNAAPGQFAHQFIKRQFAVLFQPLLDPVLMRAKLGIRPAMALPFGRKRTGLALQDHHVIHKAYRNPETGCCSTVRVAFFNKPYNSLTQLNRMWLSHGDPPSMFKENHTTADLGILNQINPDLL